MTTRGGQLDQISQAIGQLEGRFARRRLKQTATDVWTLS